MVPVSIPALHRRWVKATGARRPFRRPARGSGGHGGGEGPGAHRPQRPGEVEPGQAPRAERGEGAQRKMAPESGTTRRRAPVRSPPQAVDLAPGEELAPEALPG